MYQLIRSDRKTIAIQVKPDGSLVVRAPRRASDAEIRAALERHRSWIARHQARAAAAAPAPEERLTEAELQKLKEKLIILLELRLRWFAPRVGVSYGSVSVRNQKSRWGSCSAQGNLSFNCLLALVPMEVLDYVVSTSSATESTWTTPPPSGRSWAGCCRTTRPGAAGSGRTAPP